MSWWVVRFRADGGGRRIFTWCGATEDCAEDGRFVDAATTAAAATAVARTGSRGSGRSRGRQRGKSFGHHRCFGTGFLSRTCHCGDPGANCGQRAGRRRWGGGVCGSADIARLRHCSFPRPSIDSFFFVVFFYIIHIYMRCVCVSVCACVCVRGRFSFYFKTFFVLFRLSNGNEIFLGSGYFVPCYYYSYFFSRSLCVSGVWNGRTRTVESMAERVRRENEAKKKNEKRHPQQDHCQAVIHVRLRQRWRERLKATVG